MRPASLSASTGRGCRNVILLAGVVKGYANDEPLVPNDRGTHRRVEFNIVSDDTGATP